MHKIDTKKYISVLAITSFIFFTAIYFSNYFNNKKLAELKSIEDKIAIDILSSETQYALLQESSCEYISSSVLSQELNSLASKLSYTEGQLGNDSDEVVRLKKYYSLLQIKDYLLSKRIAQKCGLKPTFIIYLYSNKGDCADCEKEGYVLTYLRETYPDLRIYSFDYNLDLSAVKTLLSIFKIEKNLPAMVIGNKTYYGFKDKSALEALLPKNIKDAIKTKPKESSVEN